MSRISEKAKTTKQFCDELSPSCILDCPLEDKLSQVDCSICEKEKWVRVSVAQQEIDKLRNDYEALSLKMLADKLEKERERGLLKQKLQQFDIYLAEMYGRNGSVLPIVLKFQELLRE